MTMSATARSSRAWRWAASLVSIPPSTQTRRRTSASAGWMGAADVRAGVLPSGEGVDLVRGEDVAVPGVEERPQKRRDVGVVLGDGPDEPDRDGGAGAESSEEVEGALGKAVTTVDDDVADLVGGQPGGGLAPGVGGSNAVGEQAGGASAGRGEDIEGEVAGAAAGGGADDEPAGAFDGGQAGHDAVGVVAVVDEHEPGPGGPGTVESSGRALGDGGVRYIESLPGQATAERRAPLTPAPTLTLAFFSR
ncbi:hypothetical protein ACIPY6_38470 [Streptomyces sp. NPDC090054]|uniref:hypothetical protein n=1 Tax=Streptomyces sp. NPDC090054 TaxID=3365933 RepID=UPI0038254950